MYSTPSHVTWKGETQPGEQKHAFRKYPCQLSVENIFAWHSSGCELGLGGDSERTCQHIDIDIFESVYYNVDQFLAYLQL